MKHAGIICNVRSGRFIWKVFMTKYNNNNSLYKKNDKVVGGGVGRLKLIILK